MSEKDSGLHKVSIYLHDSEIGFLDRVADVIRSRIRRGELQRRGRGRPVGAGTIAACIVSRALAEHTDLIEEWFDYKNDHSQDLSPPAKASSKK